MSLGFRLKSEGFGWNLGQDLLEVTIGFSEKQIGNTLVLPIRD
ncbi:hypothetical protein RU080_12590 [Shewanella algae]|nr:hypothetical protein [Shewanella algae]MDV2962571.1 hypothetical protein [Shewanella algae]